MTAEVEIADLAVENATDAVFDDGELTLLPQPFYRGSGAREAPAGGSGLGLFIARRIAETHGFNLVLACAGGLFSARLTGPLAGPEFSVDG